MGSASGHRYENGVSHGRTPKYRGFGCCLQKGLRRYTMWLGKLNCCRVWSCLRKNIIFQRFLRIKVEQIRLVSTSVRESKKELKHAYAEGSWKDRWKLCFFWKYVRFSPFVSAATLIHMEKFSPAMSLFKTKGLHRRV